jgi:hypothetical protein
MHWLKNRWCLSLTLIWMLSGLAGCATTGIALRQGSKGYVARDTAVTAFVTDDKGQHTKVKMVLPAGSMFQTGSVGLTAEQVKALEAK